MKEAQGRDERGGAGPRWARRRRAEMSEEAQGRDERGGEEAGEARDEEMHDDLESGQDTELSELGFS